MKQARHGTMRPPEWGFWRTIPARYQDGRRNWNRRLTVIPRHTRRYEGKRTSYAEWEFHGRQR